MRIIHLSYARIHDYNPASWLKKLNFFAMQLSAMAKHAEVKSIHLINYSGILVKDEVEYHFLKTSFFEQVLPFRIHAYLKKLDPDVIIVHGLIFPWQILWLGLTMPKRVKIVAQNHAERPLRFHKGMLQRFADRFISAYFFTATDQGRSWIEAKQIKSIGKIFEVMEASSVFHPIGKSKAKSEIQIPDGLIYLWVGRLDQNKDPVCIVKAFQSFHRHQPEAKLFMIFQQDDLLDDVKRVMAGEPEVSSNIFLVGKIAHEKLLFWYNSADFIISTSHYEGSGIAVCEAMSCGCIPILTDIASFKMMTDNGHCGFLYEAGDVSGLLKALVASTTLDLAVEKKKVLDLFDRKLSFQAISDRMIQVISSL